MSLLWSHSPRSVESRKAAMPDTCVLRGTDSLRAFAKKIQPTHAYPTFVQANLEVGS